MTNLFNNPFGAPNTSAASLGPRRLFVITERSGSG